MKPLVYFTGPPGAGKTTLMAALTAGIPTLGNTKVGGMPVVSFAGGNVYELGQRRPGGFSGTDALSMSIQKTAISFATDPAYGASLLLGEGDRLANMSFFQAVEDSPRPLVIVALRLPEEERARRCSERGSNQNPTWVKGRVSKADKLEWWADLVLDAQNSTDNMLATLEDTFDWAVELKQLRDWAVEFKRLREISFKVK